MYIYIYIYRDIGRANNHSQRISTGIIQVGEVLCCCASFQVGKVRCPWPVHQLPTLGATPKAMGGDGTPRAPCGARLIHGTRASRCRIAKRDHLSRECRRVMDLAVRRCDDDVSRTMRARGMRKDSDNS